MKTKTKPHKKIKVRKRLKPATPTLTNAVGGQVLPFQMDFEESDLMASVCKDSFSDFVKEFWDVIIPEPLEWNWHMDIICQEMQEVAMRLFRGEARVHDLIINICPGSTKSTICSSMFPAWTWTHMPNCRNICASYAESLQLDFSLRTRDIVQSEKYRQYFLDINLRQDQNNKRYFINNHRGDRYCVGLRGLVTGFHGHFIIVDDPLDPERAYSEIELVTSSRWINQTLSNRKVSKRNSVVIMVMQRLNVEDPTGNRLSQPQLGPVRWICIPAEDIYPIHPPELKAKYVEGLMDPKRISRAILEQEKAKGQYYYAGQFGQTPIPLSGGMFHTDKIIIDTPPAKMTKKVRFWDCAATHEDGCYSVGFLMGQEGEGENVIYWILDVNRGQWSSDARNRQMKQTAGLDGRKVRIGVEEEGGSSGKDAALAIVRLLAGYACTPVKPTGDKLVRADPFSAAVNAGLVKMAPGEWNKPLLDELRNCGPGAKYMDQVDAGSGAFMMITKPVGKAGGFGNSGRNRKRRKVA